MTVLLYILYIYIVSYLIKVCINIICRSFERTTPIYFRKLATDESEAAGDFLKAKRDIFDMATTHCLPDIIRMSQSVNAANLANHMDYFRNHLNGLSPRLPEIYSIYRLFAREVIA